MRFHVDYLAVTMHGWHAGEVFGLLERVLGESWSQRQWEVLQKDRRRFRARGPLGSFLIREAESGWVHLSLKGEACSAIGTESLMRTCEESIEALGVGFKVSRVDLAWDDFGKRITPHRLRSEFWDAENNRKRDQVVCRAKKARFHEDDPVGSGCSYYVGSRSSSRMLRLYDKSAQSEGKTDSMRFELQNRDEAACAVVREMVRSDSPGQAALRFLVGFLDFRDPESHGSHKEWRDRCRFWAELVGDAEKATIRGRELPELEAWIARQLRQNSSAFGVLLEFCGGDLELVSDLLLSRRARQPNPNHERLRQLIRQRRASGEVVGLPEENSNVLPAR